MDKCDINGFPNCSGYDRTGHVTAAERNQVKAAGLESLTWRQLCRQELSLGNTQDNKGLHIKTFIF